ncbi:LysR family transcriptional regulator [Sinanaerobacter chloroacetimidivorans]|uniref:LysR family transcriptional regulator n=1 Tax=Sinanaerobacter chloroacetimidivorans TaxID=2818044 RepID=A0A8J7W213_9FIRM|nr:LysR family transcriptional regulator [Sinanaerobacter chloroacetimidivorans]MBR0599442.1 LysR family transcriptional regulator [Sinanaerobacter chloroacetimidivorans]
MHGNIDRYEIFLITAELGSITAAAERLGYTQSGVSRAIAMLEEECGFTLFVRSQKGVHLTGNGEQVLEPIRALVNDRQYLSQVIDEIKGLSSGTIRVGTFTSVSVNWLPKIIRGFQELYPNIIFQLFDADYSEIIDLLEMGEIDCGFLSAPVPSGLNFISLYKDPMLAVLPPDHTLAKEKSIRVEQLRDEPFLVPDTRNDADIRQLMEQLNIQPKIKYILNNEISIAAMIEHGHGVTILPSLILKDQPIKVCLRSLSPPCYRELGIASRQLRYVSPAARRFIEYTVEQIGPQH